MQATKSPSTANLKDLIHQITYDIRDEMSKAEAVVQQKAREHAAAVAVATMAISKQPPASAAEADMDLETPAPVYAAAPISVPMAAVASPAAPLPVPRTPAPATAAFQPSVSAPSSASRPMDVADVPRAAPVPSNLSGGELNLEMLQKRLDPEINTKTELKRVKEHFGKLKFTYLQTETRQSLLETVAACAPAAGATAPDMDGCLRTIAVDQNVVDKLASAVSDSKKKISATKKHIKSTKSELYAMAKSVEHKWQQFQEKKALYEQFLSEQIESKLKSEHDTRIQQNRTSAAYGSVADVAALGLSTAAQCQHVHENQLKSLAELEQTQNSLQTQWKRLIEDQLQPLQKEMDWVQRELLAAENEKTRYSKPTVVDERKNWFTNVNHVLSTINGVTAAWKPQNVLHYVLGNAPKWNGHAYELELQYSADRTLFTQPKLKCPAGSPVVFADDIASYAESMQDVQLFIRETAERIRCVATRAQHLQSLSERWSGQCKWEDGKELGTIAVTTKVSHQNRGVTAVWLLPIDYPSAGARVACAALNWSTTNSSSPVKASGSTASDEQFQRWMAEANADGSASNLLNAVSRLTRILNPESAVVRVVPTESAAPEAHMLPVSPAKASAATTATA